MKNKIKFYKFLKVASKVLLGVLIALVVLCAAALIFRACTPEKNVAYASEADGIGTWVWNYDPEMSNYEIYDDYFFDFASDGQPFMGVRGMYSDVDGILVYELFYLSDPFLPVSVFSDGTWVGGIDSAYRTIDIEVEPPAEFLTILQTNATYKSGGTPEPVTYSLLVDITNGRNETLPINTGETIQVQIVPDSGYKYPETLTAQNCTIESYSAETGIAMVSNPTSNCRISGICTIAQYTVQGKYTFLQFPLLPSAFGVNTYEQKVNFTTTDTKGNLKNWYGMYWEGYQTPGPYWALYYKETENQSTRGTIVYEQTMDLGTAWKEKYYQIVDFGNEPQEVSEKYYTWLHDNAAPGDVTQDEQYKLGYYFGRIAGLEEANSIVVENNASFNAGYEKGFSDGSDTILSGPKALFKSVVDILNIPLFGIPGFTVGAIVAIAVTLGVLLFILRIIRG